MLSRAVYNLPHVVDVKSVSNTAPEPSPGFVHVAVASPDNA